MKGLLAIGGLHLLCFLIWTCSGEQPVYVRCSPSWFLARVKPTAFDNDIPVAPNEVFLGGHCPVTSVQQGFYEFRYHPSDCDIRIQVLPGEYLLFVSEIIFMSLFSNLEASIPVACMVPRYPAPIKIIQVNDANMQSGSQNRRSGIANLHIGETINRTLKRCPIYPSSFPYHPTPEDRKTVTGTQQLKTIKSNALIGGLTLLMHVQCGPWWIQVRINAIIFDKLFAHPDELFLGEECPVTKELGDSYEFFYILPQCDIETTPDLSEVVQRKEEFLKYPFDTQREGKFYRLRPKKGQRDQFYNVAEEYTYISLDHSHAHQLMCPLFRERENSAIRLHTQELSIHSTAA